MSIAKYSCVLSSCDKNRMDRKKFVLGTVVLGILQVVMVMLK